MMPPNSRKNFGESQSNINLDKISAHVVKVHIDGLSHTKDDIIIDRVAPLFRVRHFEDLVRRSNDALQCLRSIGCFSDVRVHLDTSNAGKEGHDYVVTFIVQERKRVSGTIRTSVSTYSNTNQEASVTAGLTLPNVFGRGERFTLEYSRGSKSTNTFHGSFSKPLLSLKPTSPLFNPSITGNAFREIFLPQNTAIKETDRGLSVDLAFSTFPQVTHHLSWDGVWRQLTCQSSSASFDVRKEAGHTLKSSIKHAVVVDRRDDPIFPTKGFYFRLNKEFAGLGGDVGFIKNEIDLQVAIPVLNSSLLGTIQGGLLNHLKGDKKVTIADKFYLGGPMNIRGFESRGLGPTQDGDFIGGQSYWSSGLHIHVPLPIKGNFADLFRFHGFLTAGNNIKDFTSISKIEDVLRNFRYSYGLGLAIKLGGIARVELNYCVPVKAEKGDKIVSGFQFGIGLHFL